MSDLCKLLPIEEKHGTMLFTGEGPVRKTTEDNAKRRLTEPFEIRTVINVLRERGFPNEDLPILMTRYFYVDLDTLNDVMKSV